RIGGKFTSTATGTGDMTPSGVRDANPPNTATIEPSPQGRPRATRNRRRLHETILDCSGAGDFNQHVRPGPAQGRRGNAQFRGAIDGCAHDRGARAVWWIG